MESPCLSAGKIRALQTASTPNGIFKILAIDHRDSLRVLLSPDHPGNVLASTLTDLKLTIIKHTAPYATAVMLDPVYSAGQAVVACALPGQVGFLVALEEQGYLGDPHARQTPLLSGWSPEKAKRLGASGVKLLMYYHPDSEASWDQEDTIRAVIAECARYEIPLFLEPLFYALDRRISVNSADFAAQRRRVIVETVRRLSALGPDILKIQFPVDVTREPDINIWKDACAELDEAAAVPWALLSAGDPFDSFKVALEVACQAGCSGFMAGRALWREVVGAAQHDQAAILAEVVGPRFQELSQIADRYGKGWQRKYRFPPIDEAWYRTY